MPDRHPSWKNPQPGTPQQGITNLVLTENAAIASLPILSPFNHSLHIIFLHIPLKLCVVLVQISMNVTVRLATACQKKMADNVQTQRDLTHVLVALITMVTEYLKPAHSETILELVVKVRSDLLVMSATTFLVFNSLSPEPSETYATELKSQIFQVWQINLKLTLCHREGQGRAKSKFLWHKAEQRQSFQGFV